MSLFVIFPARNEGKTIGQCIETARGSKFKPEIIVVDGNSGDNTKKEAKDAGAIVIKQSKNIYPAKGTAMRDGAREAVKRGAKQILFLDADIINLTPEWIDLLAEPVIEKACEMSRGYYRRAEYDGAVTKLVAKPLSGVFFPEISYFNQPLSGEICATDQLFKTLLKRRDWPDGWGVDIWLLIESTMRDYQINEIYLGTKVHTSRQEYLVDVVRLSKMAEQVSLTIFNEAIKYKRIGNLKNVHL
ncbi:MAG: glycosyltransferase [Dehalococcoidales bacterium]|jgi:glucosyl-3-phosphoglycerate synthase|nr:glycosyltransferase [Dehalococcoidales bacterium]